VHVCKPTDVNYCRGWQHQLGFMVDAELRQQWIQVQLTEYANPWGK